MKIDGRSALLGAVAFSPGKALRVLRKLGGVLVWWALGLIVLGRLVWQWWQDQAWWVQGLIVGAVVGLALLLLRPRRGQEAPRPVNLEPTQVLYRYFEPDDLAPGQRCFCGKRRVAGELVYVGITRAGRARELDEDRRQACWWGPGLDGRTETFETRDEVEAAEVRAIRSERPRENRQHAAL